jgi:hypothetical protein
MYVEAGVVYKLKQVVKSFEAFNTNCVKLSVKYEETKCTFRKKKKSFGKRILKVKLCWGWKNTWDMEGEIVVERCYLFIIVLYFTVTYIQKQ